MREFSIFPYSGKKRLLCSSLPITLCNRTSIWKCEADWHMNFSLINLCGTHENNIRNHSFFWSGTYELTNVIMVTKKS